MRWAWAKINLYLEIVGRRADGYHLLESLIVFAGCGDRLSLRLDEPPGFRCAGRFAGQLPPGADNLVTRSLARLEALTGPLPPFQIELDKQLPVASGIGGGSADAAALIEGALGLGGRKLPSDAYKRLALDLGADLPVCLYGRPALVGGIGERVSRAPPLPAAWLVLVNPGVALATPAVFAAREGAFSAVRPWSVLPTTAPDLAVCLADRTNDLEAPARRLAPEIDQVLNVLLDQEGCLLARLSGSGATCFGLFAGPVEAKSAAGRIAQSQPAWWSVACPILHGKLARHWRQDP